MFALLERSPTVPISPEAGWHIVTPRTPAFKSHTFFVIFNLWQLNLILQKNHWESMAEKWRVNFVILIMLLLSLDLSKSRYVFWPIFPFFGKASFHSFRKWSFVQHIHLLLCPSTVKHWEVPFSDQLPFLQLTKRMSEMLPCHNPKKYLTFVYYEYGVADCQYEGKMEKTHVQMYFQYESHVKTRGPFKQSIVHCLQCMAQVCLGPYSFLLVPYS